MEIIVFTDGSFMKKNNLEQCGYGIYFPNKEFVDIAEPFTLKPLTNQRAELYAIYVALKKTTEDARFNKILIYSDSEYSIKSLTIWIKSWVKNNWKASNKKNVKNRDLIENIYNIMKNYGGQIIFHHVKSHTNKTDFLSLGNKMADLLAIKGALKKTK